MKKLFALILVLCCSLAAVAAFADEIGYYPDECPEVKPYLNFWAADNGNWRIEVYGEDGGIKLMVVHKLGGSKQDIWEYSAMMNTDKTALTAVPLGLHYRQDTDTYEWDATYYEDGDAEFTLTADGGLVWHDLKEDAGNGLVFDPIGDYLGGRWMKGAVEVIFRDWQDGKYDILLCERGESSEILRKAAMTGVYDPETDTITAEGGFDPDAPAAVTFSRDAHSNVVWTENGESTVMEYSFQVDNP